MNLRKYLKQSSGFTLIELIIVLVLIGILAAVAIPRFVDLTSEAEEASLRGTLGNVRSAVTIFRAEQLATNPGGTGWPTVVQMTTLGSVLTNPMPPNPRKTGGTADPDGVRDGTGDAMGDVSGDEGWAYDPTSGNFWANSSTDGENDW